MALESGRVALALPDQLITRADVSRLIREIEIVENYFLQISIKSNGSAQLPQLSSQLAGFVNFNRLNISEKIDRHATRTYLEALKKMAPLVHISFAAEPRPDFIVQISSWFRKNVHPQVLFHIGLRPSIAAGCIVRTTNKYFDFSIHKNLLAAKPKLVEALEGTE